MEFSSEELEVEGGCKHSATQEPSKTASNNTNTNTQQNSPNVAAGGDFCCCCCCSCHCCYHQRYKDSKFERNKQNKNNCKHSTCNQHSSTTDSSNNVWGLLLKRKLQPAVTQKNHKIFTTPINFTLALFTMTFAVLLQQQQQQVTASPLPHTTVALASSAATLPQALPTAVARAGAVAVLDGGSNNDRNVLRLRKRHSNWHERYAREMNSQEMEWANPCGGEWLHNLTEQPMPPPRMSVKRHLRMLQSSVGKEQKTIKALTPAINISDMKMWSLHKASYKFLPVLKLKSNTTQVALRRWHRQMQLYVASFAYLRRAQIQWDHVKLQRESEISKELLKLKQSARYILCEIETAINKTLAQGGVQGASASNASHVKKSHQLRLHFLSRDAVEKRLKFQTHIRFLYAPANYIERQRHQRQQSGELQEVNPIDLKFVKYRYFGYLRGILKNLRRHARRSSELIMESGSASSAASGSKQEDTSLQSHSEQEESRAVYTNSLEQALNRSTNNTSGSRRKKPMRRRKNRKGENDGNASRNASRRRQNKQQQEEAAVEQPVA